MILEIYWSDLNNAAKSKLKELAPKSDDALSSDPLLASIEIDDEEENPFELLTQNDN